jgi:adenosylcobinamide-GDP ribazoletransferase
LLQDFLTGLQFLTRLKFSHQTTWSPEIFGRSVRYFPLIGAIIGLSLVAVNIILGKHLPPNVLAVILIAVEIIITGGLHGDGLMDTADGIFSGRNRERMLEIMKDSRVGANGVMAFCLVVLLKWSLLMDMTPTHLITALFIMPVVSRFSMVVGITCFPYARPDGMGKAFAQYAGKKALLVAAVITGILVFLAGKFAFAGLAAALVFTLLFGKYVTGILGGLTGDAYGAITELSELVILFVFLIL